MKTTIERGGKTKAFLLKRLPPDVHAAIVEAAAREHMSMTQWMITTLFNAAKKKA